MPGFYDSSRFDNIALDIYFIEGAERATLAQFNTAHKNGLVSHIITTGTLNIDGQPISKLNYTSDDGLISFITDSMGTTQFTKDGTTKTGYIYVIQN